jgi:DNA-binding response OmpR family regulator
VIPASKSALDNSRVGVLVVDADADVRGPLARTLRKSGFCVQEAASGPAALQLLETKPFDLMVVDLGIPGISGVEVMLRARLMRRDLLIIVLTGQATIESAIAAVKTDVVDYMLKPCRIDDLMLTITRAMAERAEQVRHQHLLDMVGETMEALQKAGTPRDGGSGAPDSTFAARAPELLRVGVLALDRQKRLATLTTDPPRTVELTEGEASILTALMEKPNQVFTYNQLAKTALGYEGMDKWTVESVIRSSVFRLRQKIEPSPDSARLICTVRGRGYYFSQVIAQTVQ